MCVESEQVTRSKRIWVMKTPCRGAFLCGLENESHKSHYCSHSNANQRAYNIPCIFLLAYCNQNFFWVLQACAAVVLSTMNPHKDNKKPKQIL